MAAESTEGVPNAVSRQELYDLAWREPMLRIAERFGVSSSYLARVYTELKVPRPGPGYWAQREFGKAPPQPELPTCGPGDLLEWVPGESVGSVVKTISKARAASAEMQAGATSQRLDEPGPRPRRRRIRPASDQHDLLIGIKAHFAKTRDSKNGILRPYKRMLVDLMASPSKLDAVIDAAQNLFSALHRRGSTVTFAQANGHSARAELDLLDKPSMRTYYRTLWSPERPTVVHIGGITVGLSLFEMTEEVEVVYLGNSLYVPVQELSAAQLQRLSDPFHWRSHEERPSGRLCLQAYCPGPTWGIKWSKRWQEEKPNTFKGMIASIVEELEVAAPDLAKQLSEAKRRAEEEHRRWVEERRRREVEAELKRREKIAQEARQDLLDSISAWAEAKRVHDFFASVEVHIGELPEQEASGLGDRLKLAKALIGELDPIGRLRQWKSPEERTLQGNLSGY
jgi:hypothetical protein